MSSRLLSLQLQSSNARRVIIESPCAPSGTFTWDEHEAYLRRCLQHSIALGEAPIASHGLFAFSRAFEDADPAQRNACMIAGHAWLVAAEAVAVYLDYGISKGMQQGIELAEAMAVPVDYRRLGVAPAIQQSTAQTGPDDEKR